jgi:signal transduction histidine kinase
LKVTLYVPPLKTLELLPVFLNFAVVDTGTGVGEGAEESIFKPFVSNDGSTGLGLFVIKSQCEALGGECGVMPNPSGLSACARIPAINPSRC